MHYLLILMNRFIKIETIVFEERVVYISRGSFFLTELVIYVSVLPKFEVTLDLPPFGRVKDSQFEGKVKAMYVTISIVPCFEC